MKKHEFLALEASEFIDMVDGIARERVTLRTKKKTDDSIFLMVRLGVPISRICYKVEKTEEHLNVYRKVNWFPLFYSTVPIVLILEAIMFAIFYFSEKSGLISYILVGAFWVLSLTFMMHQTFVELEEVYRKLYRVGV